VRRAGLALLGLLFAAFGAVAGAEPGDGPPKPPKPKLELLTETQQAALRREAIKLSVASKRGKQGRVEATLVVGGFPSDYNLKLGADTGRLRDGEAELRLALSARQREVLAFGAQACEPATLHAQARAGGRGVELSHGLRRPQRC